MTTIPSPPIHCVSALQKREACGRASTSFKIEDPVVVNPDIISKKASGKEGMYPLIISGRLPNTVNNIHTHDTMKYPSLLARTLSLTLTENIRMQATARVIPAEIRKASASSSP